MGRIKGKDYNLLGKRFGRLIVLKQNGIKLYNNKHNILWLCLCDCGNETDVTTYGLTSGTISCGCAAIEGLKGRTADKHGGWCGYEGISGTFWNRLVRNAANRNKEFHITKEYIWTLIVKQNFKCALSGVDIYLAKSSKEFRTKGLNTASLDRIDNNIGYIEGNLQWVHADINYMKQDLSQDRFIEFCKLVASKQDV